MKKKTKSMESASSAKPKQLELFDSEQQKERCVLRFALTAQNELDFILIFWRIKPEAHADATMFAKGRAYTPKEKKAYMEKLTFMALQAMSQHQSLLSILPITKSLIARWTFIVPQIMHPKGHAHMYDFHYKDTRPDTDGFLKVPKDCIQKRKLFKLGKDRYRWGAGIIEDDALIVNENVVKVYAKRKPSGICLLLKPSGREFKSPEYLERIISAD